MAANYIYHSSKRKHSIEVVGVGNLYKNSQYVESSSLEEIISIMTDEAEKWVDMKENANKSTEEVLLNFLGFI